MGSVPVPAMPREYFRTGHLSGPAHRAAKRSLWHVQTASCLHLKCYLIVKKEKGNKLCFVGLGASRAEMAAEAMLTRAMLPS